jgi:hypothetical protein
MPTRCAAHRSRARAAHARAGGAWAPTPARAQGDFFSSSPGALSESHAGIDGPDHCNDCHNGGRDALNDKCLGCHDHSDLKSRIAVGQGLPRVEPGQRQEVLVVPQRAQGPRLRPDGLGRDPRRHQGLRPRRHRLEARGQALRGRLRRLPQDQEPPGPAHLPRPGPAVRHLPQGRSAPRLRAARDAGVRALPRPERVEPAQGIRTSTTTTSATRSMPLVGSHEDVSCEKCHPKALFNLKGNNPDFCGNCHDSPHDGMLFGKKECEWCHSPAFGALDKFKFDHDKKTSVRAGPRPRQDEVRGVPHPGARRAQARQDLRGRRLPRRRQQARRSLQRVRRRSAVAARPATCRRRAWTSGATNFNHDKKTKFKLTGRTTR